MLRAALIAVLAVLPISAQAQATRASHCIAIAEGEGSEPPIWPAAYRGGLDPFEVRLSYIDHSMILIETGGGATAVTDYNGFIGATDFHPDIATMNRAHSSHWTSNPDPRIAHLMRGWDGPDQGVEVADLYVRNVTTDIRGSVFDDGVSSAQVDGNSIYVFEAAGLCIAHLGHLHHEPDDGQYAALGRMDVVIAPVDGGRTLPRETMIRVLGELRTTLVIPVHWFGRPNMERFVADIAAAGFEVARPERTDMVVSLRTLPERPTITVLEPEWLVDPAE